MTTAPQTASAREVVDPVCGMTIDPADAVGQAEHNGQTYYFCAESCLERFRADPAQFLGASARSAPSRADAGRDYTCPMDPEVRQSGPGSCPKCGMALEPVTVGPATRTMWTCPMHPEVVQDAPGSCPICGMALEPTTVAAEEEDNAELRDMTRRFWTSAALTAPLVTSRWVA